MIFSVLFGAASALGIAQGIAAAVKEKKDEGKIKRNKIRQDMINQLSSEVDKADQAIVKNMENKSQHIHSYYGSLHNQGIQNKIDKINTEKMKRNQKILKLEKEKESV